MELISMKTLEFLQAWVMLGHYCARASKRMQPTMQNGLLLNFSYYHWIFKHSTFSDIATKKKLVVLK